ncbi:type II secretion system protein GspC [Algiphilus sp.]|uniref:type II secretion system protein GspC n=1 Tax=Algiphilus sp. TaxID=1872431 RepID=UPI001CA69121|nr:type II secretion system protein GspC [Algiphilus sp.]MBY8966407.1 type II secretion system protein GspC [Algiphilus acroporae]MCI5103250.1 type II secretion system protein GspC [Algiphilus sp.]MCR9091078.1 type II secretion system protein GspC [Pseudomonadota bacterium]
MNASLLLQLYERHVQRAAGLAALVLAVVFGACVARLAWALVPPPANSWQPAPVERQARSNAEPAAPYNLARLTNANLMGTFQKAAEPEPQDVEDAPETRLSLKLLGVYAAEDPSLSRAIIAAANQDEKLYAIGDKISNNVELHSVFPDRVVIARDGKLETLRMERDGIGDRQPARTQQNLRSQSRVTDDGNLTARNPQKLGEIRNELLADPTRATNYIRVVPASSGGQQQGYRIYPGRERELFEAAGLRPGDLVTAVNGISLDSPDTALRLLNELSNAQSINVTVERGGNIQNYTLSTQ